MNKSIKEKAVALFEKGFGYKAVASKLNITRSLSREWHCTWKALGSDGFLKTDPKHRLKYPQEIRDRAVQDYLNGMSAPEVMAKYKIRCRPLIYRWAKKRINK